MSVLEAGGGASAGAARAPDDTARLRAVIQRATSLHGHTEYTINVQCGPSKENKWSVSRRYRDFAALHAALQAADVTLSLPPKKLIGNMNPAFIAERQMALQNYLTEVLKHQILALSLPVRQFLDPKNYPLSLHELALQNVSIALRGDGGYELKGPVPDIGWRIRKRYFLVSNEQRTKPSCLLCWQQYGPDKYLADKDMQSALKCLQNISHPYIDQVLLGHGLELGAYVIRSVREGGSVRDQLYGAEYGRPYLSKYGNPKVRRPFTNQQIRHYGRQMLLALQFLHEKGLPYGHLHPGNIAIDNQRVLLLDIENGVLGAPSLYRPYILEHKSLNTLEAVDVYSFGRTIYEMACAAPLDQSSCDIFPNDVTDDLVSVLRLCLSSTACKYGRTSIETLLRHPFFSSSASNGLAAIDAGRPPHLKLPLPLKEQLRLATAALEARLHSEQKMVRSERREVRIQEILNSDEKMRRQKKKLKKRDSVWKSSSSLTEAGGSRSVSTTSSPTPPHLPADTRNNSSISVTAASLPPDEGSARAPCSPPPDGRSALLSAISSFNKSNLQRVDSR